MLRRVRPRERLSFGGNGMGRLVLSLALLALSAICAQAQNYPTRTVTVIVPFAAGGPADITGRIVADILARYLH